MDHIQPVRILSGHLSDVDVSRKKIITVKNLLFDLLLSLHIHVANRFILTRISGAFTCSGITILTRNPVYTHIRMWVRIRIN